MRRALLLALVVANAGCGDVIGIDDMDYVPREEPGDVVALAALNCSSCAVREDGTVWCWGANDFGQLGKTGVANFGVPVQVEVPEPVDAVAVGTLHACAYPRGGDHVWCWGGDAAGQASKTWDPPTKPEDLDTLLLRTAGPKRIDLPAQEQVERVAAGFLHTCVLTVKKNVYCWGANHAGQCGAGLPDGLFTTVPKAGKCGWDLQSVAGAVITIQYQDDVIKMEPHLAATDVDEVVVQRHTTCVNKSGAVRCWGGNCGSTGEDWEYFLGNDCSDGGQLGKAPDTACYSDEATKPLTDPVTPKALSLGHLSGFVAVTGSKVGVLSWGWDDGQLGHGPPTGKFSPPAEVMRSETDSLPPVTAVALTNGWHQLARASSGAWYSWGRDDCGELGQGPAHVGANADFAAKASRIPQSAKGVVSGQDHTCFLRNGRVYCMGHGLYVGQPTNEGESNLCAAEGCSEGNAAPRPEPAEVLFE